MSAVLPVCSGAAAVRAFIKAGWVVDRQRGSHVMLKKDGSAAAAWQGSFAVVDCRFRAQCRGVCEVSLIPSPSLFCASYPYAHVRHGYFQFVNFTRQ
jgi:hypothetical protein